jgi:hemoglobin-like flavoprotein
MLAVGLRVLALKGAMPVTRHPLLATKHGANSITVDSEAITRLEASLSVLTSRGERIADRFYQRLFATAPAMRQAFPADIAAQHRKFIDMLVAVVQLLRKPEEAGQLLRETGSTHRKYGARPEHYALVGQSLLEAMALEFGDAWSEQLAQEWSQAIELVSSAMIEAGSTAHPYA